MSNGWKFFVAFGTSLACGLMFWSVTSAFADLHKSQEKEYVLNLQRYQTELATYQAILQKR